MDSGNSNSMQSSSGGGDDQEYDSRAESISSFLNNNNHPSSYPPLPAPAPAPAQHFSFFDPLSSNYTFDPLSSSRLPPPSSSSSSLPLNSTINNPNSLLNLDMVWSKSLRSEPTRTDIDGLFIPTTSSSFSSSPALHIPQEETVSVSKASFFNNTTLARNPKKRTRASRRAPTTVLTTDTTNFRAMVQEFTGIPAPPFTSSPFPRTRLDLFGTSSRSTAYSHLDSSSPSPSYNLLRPFAQKLINPVPFTSSITTAAAATTSTNINYQLPSQNFLHMNMQNNPILNLHSLLQVPPKYPLPNSSILETKPPPQGSSLEELGLSHAGAGAVHLNTNLVSGLQSWPGDGTGTGTGVAAAAAAGSHENEELGLFANGKLSIFSQATSSEFHRDKGQENVNVAAPTTRTEGMVESWICSSD